MLSAGHVSGRVRSFMFANQAGLSKAEALIVLVLCMATVAVPMWVLPAFNRRGDDAAKDAVNQAVTAAERWHARHRTYAGLEDRKKGLKSVNERLRSVPYDVALTDPTHIVVDGERTAKPGKNRVRLCAAGASGRRYCAVVSRSPSKVQRQANDEGVPAGKPLPSASGW